jgi:hypothetical protein
VEDADEPVGQGAECLVVGVAAGAVGVVVGAGAGWAGQRGEGLLIERVGEAPVAGVAGQHGPGLPGGAGDRGHAGVVLARSGVAVAVGIVAELGKHPGTEDLPEPGLAQVDLSVRVPAKTLGQHLLQLR